MKDIELLENEHFQWVTTRKYWDIYAHQFSEISAHDKLARLAQYLDEGGNLHYAIEKYKVDRAKYILNCLPITIYYYLDYIRTEQPADIMSYMLSLYLSDHQMIEILSAELKVRMHWHFERGKKIYRVTTGGYDIETYLSHTELSRKETLKLVIKGELEEGFSVGYFNENIDLDAI